MPTRAIALAAVLVTVTLSPLAETTADEAPGPSAPDLDEMLTTLELPSRPAESVVPAPPVAAASASNDAGAGRGGKKVGDALARIRSCESGSNYRARSASGRYRGAYQFDHATFASVGGKGDPAAASPAEQDGRARLLYAQRGKAAWPVCAGRA